MNNRPQPGSRSRLATMPGRYEDRQQMKPPPRRSALQFLPLALGAVAGVALVLIGIAIFSHRSDAAQSPSVAPVAQHLCADLTTQRYDDLYGLLSTAEQGLGTRAQFVASQQQLDAQLGAAHSCSYALVGQNSASATLTLTLARGTAPAATAQAQLTLEHNSWRIGDYDSSLVNAVGGPSLR